jgi:hypothetical protein
MTIPSAEILATIRKDSAGIGYVLPILMDFDGICSFFFVLTLD